ncbi:ricin-type beta-trefoil lectin domain protein [Herbidospora mongoliensis]|uniref:ricin-type beta-trefoil lectin domain protein n=1 Tax=Herbidospora mongoliensis TaxID=688067 RepID=UPI000A0341A0|nr:ricin-type beta-trefoil lectin domain protein [Herbidospora mongoliensis]
MRRTILTSAVLVLGVAFGLPSGPASAAAPEPASPEKALQRDLGLTPAEARIRQAHEAAAILVEKSVKSKLGDRFGGAWYSPGSERLQVGVLNETDAALVTQAGGAPVQVGRSEKQLATMKSALDRVKPDAKVHAWYVDPATNSVVVAAADQAGGAEFARKAAVDAKIVVTQAPKPLYDIRGGDQYVINGNTLCSVGFSVNNGGFVTAGHCGGTGSPTLGYNNVSQGNFAGSSFPTNDYAWVRTNANWTPRPWVNNYGGGSASVAGSNEAANGSSICRSGRTTGWRCGVVQAKNVTVNYGNGQLVYGLTQTTACAEGGDSGGAWITGDQAQGVTSGGSGNCSTGGTTFFQPVNEILGAYGLTLTTTGGGGATSRLIGWQDKCVDVPNSNGADGQRLQLWDCNGTNAQNWTFPGDGTVRAFGLCMDVAWGSTANGAVVQLATCSGNAAQQFVLSGAGDLVNPQANKCVDVTGWGGPGTPLQLWECNGGANQKWRRA